MMAHQTGANGGRSARPWHLMFKPPPGPAGFIQRLPRDPRRPVEMLHGTLLSFGELRLLDEHVRFRLVRALDLFRAAPFRVVFDRLLGTGDMLLLSGSDRMDGVARFQQDLVNALKRRGIRPFPRLEPHITLNYRTASSVDCLIDGISWQVEEYLLVESIHGERRHVLHGSWPLIGS